MSTTLAQYTRTRTTKRNMATIIADSLRDGLDPESAEMKNLLAEYRATCLALDEARKAYLAK